MSKLLVGIFIVLFSSMSFTSFALNHSEIEGELTRMSSKDTFGFEFVILEKDGNFVYVLGEAHLKNFFQKKQGADLVALFPLIAFEQVPKNELNKVMSKVSTEQWMVITFYKSVLTYRIPTFLFGLYASTIIDAIDNADTVISPDSECYEEEVLKALAQFNPEQMRLAIGLEGGDEIKDVQDSSRYTFDARNPRMASNIELVFNNIPAFKNSSLLVIVGRSHLDGLSSEMQKRNFTVCNSKTKLTESKEKANIRAFTNFVPFGVLILVRYCLRYPESLKGLSLSWLAFRASMEITNAIYYSLESFFKTNQIEFR